MAEKKEVNPKYCQTPEGRVSFPQVFEAKEFNNDGKPKFSLTLLFPKTTDLKALKSAVFAAATEEWGPKEKWPKNLALPFKDGDEVDYDGYAGMISVKASSKDRPMVIGPKKEVIAKEDGTFYAGCFARASLMAGAYGGPGTGYKPGVTFYLQNIQKLRDGEPFSGKRSAMDEFDAVEDNSDAESSYDDDMGF